MGNNISKELYYNNINEIIQHQHDKMYIFLLHLMIWIKKISTKLKI
jgi:hypothetical protein